jgi:catechol 2,3-dioxygenase-like lactoylglutathione lyase family enzyme
MSVIKILFINFIVICAAFFNTAFSKNQEWPVNLDGGWQEAVLSVSDVDQWSLQLQDIAGWTVLGEAKLDSRQLTKWGLISNVSARSMVLYNEGEDQGLVRLIEFSELERLQIRSSAQPWDTGGFFSLLTRSRGVEANFQVARKYQWTGYNDPVILHLGPQRRLRNVVFRGPDGINFGVYERIVPDLPGWPNIKKMSRPFNAMQIVRNRDLSVTFYEEVLGFKAMHIGNSAASSVASNNFGLPSNLVTTTPLKSAIMHPTGGETGRVEFIEWGGISGRDLSSRARAPNLGILTLRFPVSDVKKRAQIIVENGGSLLTEPSKVNIFPYGLVDLFSVMTPDGVFLEFFQPL